MFHASVSRIFAAAILLVEIPSLGAKKNQNSPLVTKGGSKKGSSSASAEDSPWKIQPLKKKSKI